VQYPAAEVEKGQLGTVDMQPDGHDVAEALVEGESAGRATAAFGSADRLLQQPSRQQRVHPLGDGGA
jgi:hypothetical protein